MSYPGSGVKNQESAAMDILSIHQYRIISQAFCTVRLIAWLVLNSAL